MSTQRDSHNDGNSAKDIPFWRMVLSVMQAAFGVQNRKNRERDFASASIKGFVVAALIFTTLLVLVLVTVVQMVLP